MEKRVQRTAYKEENAVPEVPCTKGTMPPKDEVKEAEQIRKSVDSILRQEQREHAPHRTQKREL